MLTGAGFQPVIEEKSYETGENQHIGRGRGKAPAPMVVRITMDGKEITSVEILERWETVGLAAVDRALETLPAAIAQAGSPDVDVVAGATRTSVGIIAAVSDALSQVA